MPQMVKLKFMKKINPVTLRLTIQDEFDFVV